MKLIEANAAHQFKVKLPRGHKTTIGINGVLAYAVDRFPSNPSYFIVARYDSRTGEVQVTKVFERPRITINKYKKGHKHQHRLKFICESIAATGSGNTPLSAWIDWLEARWLKLI